MWRVNNFYRDAGPSRVIALRNCGLVSDFAQLSGLYGIIWNLYKLPLKNLYKPVKILIYIN